MKIAIAQLNPTVGDIKGNLDKLTNVVEQVKNDAPDLVVFSELFITGYPPRDLLERTWFIENVELAVNCIKSLSSRVPDTGILVGVPVRVRKETGHCLHNSALLFLNGEIVFTQHKSLLPYYDVFDEERYFDPASEIDTFRFKDEILGINICEDAWNASELSTRRLYKIDPISILAAKGTTLFINISSSPFFIGKENIRFAIISKHASKYKVPFVYVNQTGANDELIFDGRSFGVDSSGLPFFALPSFSECVSIVETKTPGSSDAYKPQDEIESAHDALVLGIKDYMGKCGFRKAVIGLSGGIDSAVVAVLAARAIGAENVLTVAMPSRYSKEESTTYARILAESIGAEFRIIPIDPIYQAYIDNLRSHLAIEDKVDIALENIQARIRGNILMAISNKFGSLVLSTGNKSELAVGYSTLYGDMSGGLAVISDVPKTMVYKIASFINRDREVIPKWIIDRVPTAELRPDQKDQDTLPPYPILDEIIHCYVDLNMSMEEIIGRGIDKETVKWVISAIDRNEYKRRQAAPGLKITSKAFGTGRRMPIAARTSYPGILNEMI